MLRILLLVVLASTVHSVDVVDTNIRPTPYVEAFKSYGALNEKLWDKVLGDPKKYPKNHKNLRSVLAVLDGLVSALAEQQGAKYDVVFQTLSGRLYNAANNNLDIVDHRLPCVTRDVENHTAKLRGALFKNKNLQDICIKAPEFCNELIDGIVKTADNSEELLKESQLLLALQWHSRLFNDEFMSLLYDNTVNTDQYSAYGFLVKSKDVLKPLVESAANIRRLLNDDNCSMYKLPYDKYPPMMM